MKMINKIWFNLYENLICKINLININYLRILKLNYNFKCVWIIRERERERVYYCNWEGLVWV